MGIPTPGDHLPVLWPTNRPSSASVQVGSLSLAFLALFLFSIAMHAIGGASAYSQEQIEHGAQPVSVLE